MNDVLNGIELHDLQCVDVLKMLYNKRGIVIYETGLGKTYLMSAFIKMLINQDPTRRFIIFCTKNQLHQTPKKITDSTGLVVMASDGDKKNIKRLMENDNYLNCHVLLLTYACLLNTEFTEFIRSKFFTRNENGLRPFTGILVDEAHKMNNKQKASAAGMLEAMLDKVEYAWFMTATPVTTGFEQFARLANMLDKEKFPRINRLKNELLSGQYKIENDPLFFIQRNGTEFGRVTPPIGGIVWSDPTDEQDYSGMDYKGPGAVNQVKDLVEMLNGFKSIGKKGLVYVYRHEVRKFLLRYLDDAGFNYRCINGMTSHADRGRYLKEFNEDNSLDFIITSVTEALDMDCDYVYFYEFTCDVQQMIGRARRGFDDKELMVLFQLTKGTAEVVQFYNNIFKRAELIESILKTDNRVILELESELRKTGVAI